MITKLSARDIEKNLETLKNLPKPTTLESQTYIIL